MIDSLKELKKTTVSSMYLSIFSFDCSLCIFSQNIVDFCCKLVICQFKNEKHCYTAARSHDFVVLVIESNSQEHRNHVTVTKICAVYNSNFFD